MTYPDFLKEWHNNDDVCRVMTSGSTGTPKEIKLPKEMMRQSARRTISFFSLCEGSRIHSCISPDFIGGKMMAVRADLGNLLLTWEQPSNRPTIPTTDATGLPLPSPLLIALVPSQMLHILEAGIPDYLSSTIWLIGGSAINPALRKRIEDTGIEAWESYGMTETSSHIALRRVRLNQENFRPLPGVEIDTDSRGCLVIRLDGAEIHTNDIAKIDSDGTFRILGRIDNVIISGGKKIHPEHVESKMMQHLSPLGVTAVMLTSEPDIKWGERLKLLIEYPAAPPEPAQLGNEGLMTVAASMARQFLQKHEVPKEYIVVRGLPRTPNGKLQREKVANIN